MFEIKVKLGPDHEGSVFIDSDSIPNEKAKIFCMENRLDFSIIPALEKFIGQKIMENFGERDKEAYDFSYGNKYSQRVSIPSSQYVSLNISENEKLNSSNITPNSKGNSLPQMFAQLYPKAKNSILRPNSCFKTEETDRTRRRLNVHERLFREASKIPKRRPLSSRSNDPPQNPRNAKRSKSLDISSRIFLIKI